MGDLSGVFPLLGHTRDLKTVIYGIKIGIQY